MCDNVGELGPFTFLGRLCRATNMDEARDTFGRRDANLCEHASVIGVPLGNPARGVTHRVGGHDQVHGRGAG